MAAWLIRVAAKPREKIDAHLVAQAVIAYARQRWERERQARRDSPSRSGGREAPL